MADELSRSPSPAPRHLNPMAVVPLSGGVDSFAAAASAVQEGFDLALIHFNCGQKTEEAELAAFKRIAAFFQVPPERRLVAHTSFFSLVESAAAPPVEGSPEGPGVRFGSAPMAPAPFIQGVFLAKAVSWAEVLGAKAVYSGAVSADFPACPERQPRFVEAFNALVDAGTRPETAIEVRAPLAGLTKADIVRLSLRHALPLDLTWSCRARNDLACGACEPCRRRLRGFKEAGAEDPLIYARPAHEAAALRIEKARRLKVLLHALTGPTP